MTRPIRAQTIDSIKSRCVEEGDCLLWTGGLDGHGRPQCRHLGKSAYVRRVLRELVDGKPIPPGMQVACTCGNKLCVSEVCSLVGSSRTRARLASERGAFSGAAKAARIALTKAAKSRFSAQTIEMVRNYPGTAKAAAKEVGMSASHAKAIRRGESRTAGVFNPFAGLLS